MLFLQAETPSWEGWYLLLGFPGNGGKVRRGAGSFGVMADPWGRRCNLLVLVW